MVEAPYLSLLAMAYSETEITAGPMTGVSFIDPSHMSTYKQDSVTFSSSSQWLDEAPSTQIISFRLLSSARFYTSECLLNNYYS